MPFQKAGLSENTRVILPRGEGGKAGFNKAGSAQLLCGFGFYVCIYIIGDVQHV